MADTPTEIEDLFDEYYPVGKVIARNAIEGDKAELATQVLRYRRDKFKTAITQLLIKEREDEVNKAMQRLSTITTFTPAGWELMSTYLAERDSELKGQLR